MKRSSPPFGGAGPASKQSRRSWDDEDGFVDDEAPSEPKAAAVVDDDEEEDPLDAFMRQNDQEVVRTAAAPTSNEAAPRAARQDIDEVDDIESYVTMMQAKGHEFGKVPVDAADRSLEDDEEAQPADDAPSRRRPDVEPLAAVDHSAIQYIDIEKDFYEEHSDISGLSNEQVEQLRRDLDIRVFGGRVPRPCTSFAHFGFDEQLLSTIRAHGYTEPTPIQRQAIPIALSGRDLIGVAKTGSGKTAAYLLPMMVHIMDQPDLQPGDGPIGIVLAPTRELCVQIYSETKKFAKGYGLKALPLYGGADKMEQFRELRRGGVAVVIATPGRFIDLVKMKALSLQRVSFVVLDEADRMFDLGFEPQVRSIVRATRPDRQTLLFSATFNRRVEYLSRDALSHPVRINVGQVGEFNSDVTQHFEVLQSEGEKWPWLSRKLAGLCVEGLVILFVSRKGIVDDLASLLNDSGYRCGALHGDLQQGERERTLSQFKKGAFMVLVATDVAARGLDIPDVRSVINYDPARDVDSHVHRIGRTGRAGVRGDAYTLLTPKDDGFAADMVKHLEMSGTAVPEDVLHVAMRNHRFRSFRMGEGGRGRGRGRRGRGGVGWTNQQRGQQGGHVAFQRGPGQW